MANASCGICKREWQAVGQAHCKSCCEHFNSDSAFDRHRRNFECLPAERFGEVIGKKHPKPRLVPIEHPAGVIWATERRDPATPQHEPSPQPHNAE